MTAGRSGPEVLVVGGLNADLIVRLDRRPEAGETVMAAGVLRRCGGKGANQAVAAAAAGARTSILGAVGDDSDGHAQLADLDRFGIGTGLVERSTDLPTGLAVITLTPNGENAIVVVQGANALTTAARVREAAPRWGTPPVIVAQAEVGGPTIDAVAEVVRERGGRLLISNGPVVRLTATTLAQADPLVVNEHEAALMLGGRSGQDSADLASQLMSQTRALSLVVTLGSRGAIVADDNGITDVAAEPADVVDTTGAGDTFVGALAARLATDPAELATAVKQASLAAGRCVTWVGARPPNPS